MELDAISLKKLFRAVAGFDIPLRQPAERNEVHIQRKE